VRTVAHLIPAARAARAALAETGLSLSRDHLADVMRDAGYGVSNERASLLLKVLKAEQDMTTIDPATVATSRRAPESLPEVVA
jgi:ribosomal protein L12E/L44/L45/RPP1/RPP2